MPEGLLYQVDPESVVPVLEALLPATPIFGIAFRYNSGRALMMGVKKAAGFLCGCSVSAGAECGYVGKGYFRRSVPGEGSSVDPGDNAGMPDTDMGSGGSEGDSS